MKYLAIDYGEKRIGLATGEMIPVPFGVIENSDLDETAGKIAEICLAEAIEKIIVGLPFYDDGGESELSNKIKSFGRVIADKTGLEVAFEIENFTSSEAERILRGKGIDFRRDKGKVDELAAALLLEQYIESKKNG